MTYNHRDFRLYPDRFTRSTLKGEGDGDKKGGATKYNSPSRVGLRLQAMVRTRNLRTRREYIDAAGWLSSTTKLAVVQAPARARPDGFRLRNANASADE